MDPTKALAEAGLELLLCWNGHKHLYVAGEGHEEFLQALTNLASACVAYQREQK